MGTASLKKSRRDSQEYPAWNGRISLASPSRRVDRPYTFDPDDRFHPLSLEVIQQICLNLDPKSLAMAALVSRFWLDFTEDAHVWKANIATRDPHGKRFHSHQLLLPSHLERQYKQLYFALVQADLAKDRTLSLINNGLAQSSCDSPDQSIVQTLDNNDRTFWSSKGSSDVSSCEYLTYSLHQLSIIYSVDIYPYMASYQQGEPIYAPQAVRISVGFSADTFHWTSDPIEVENVDKMQRISIAPELVVGTHVKVTLVGRCQTQPQDDLYYTVLTRVEVHGRPWGAIEPDIISGSMLYFAMSQKEFLFQVEDPELRKVAENEKEFDQEFLKKFSKSMKDQIIYILTKEESKHQRWCQLSEAMAEFRKECGTSEESRQATMMKSKLLNFLKDLPAEERTDEVYKLFEIEGMKRIYFTTLARDRKPLNPKESLEFVKEYSRNPPPNFSPFVAHLLEARTLTPSLVLGDFLRGTDDALALRVYLGIPATDKILEILLDLREFQKYIRSARVWGCVINYENVLTQVYRKNPGAGLLFAKEILQTPGAPLMPGEDVCRCVGIQLEKDEWDLRKRIEQRLQTYGQENAPIGLLDDLDIESDDDDEDDEEDG
eukprot:TRINITY_DN5705_c0_g1_i1.p1 TRINITY_DN5705_c0_g1~~TRINITY_DN5705_c0_g1_i1.p1  ORF type:complete len:620 (+),score=164.13 TRINITY_DN5705_c0_g1_i1:51-1862(+)